MASQELWDAIDNFDYKEYLRRKGLSEDKIPETLDDSKKAALFKAANDDYFANLVEQYKSDPFMKKADAEDKAREKLLEGRPWIRPLYGLWEEEKTAEELYSPDTVLAEVIRRNNITPSANGSINTQNFTPGLANKEINDVIEQYAEAITSRPGLKYDAPELDGVSKSKFIEEFKYRNGLSNFETVKSFIDLYQKQRVQRLREQQEADPDYNWQTAALKEGTIGGWEMLGNAMQYWGDVFMNWSDSISDSSQQLFGVRLNQRVDRTDPASSLVLRMRNKGIQWRDEAISDRAKHGYIPRYDGTLQDYWNEGGPWAKALWEQALTNWPSVAQNVLPFAVGAGLVPVLGRAAAMRAGLGLAGLSAIGPGGALSTGDVLQDLNDLGIYNPEEVNAMLPYVVGAVALDFGSDVLGVLGVTGLGRSASSAVLNKVFAGRAEREAAKQALFRMAEAAGGVSADTVAGAAARVSLGMQARQVLANGAGFFGKATERYLLPGMGAFMTELWTERAQEDLAMQLANYASSPAIQGKSAWESTKDLAKAWADKGFNPRNILPWGDETMFVQDANGAIYPQRLQRHRLLSAGLLGGLMGGGTHTIVTGIQDLAGFTPERAIRDMSEKLQILDKDGNPVLGQVEKRRRGMAERLFAVLQQRNQGVTEQSVVGIDIENNGGNVIASFNGHTGTGSNAAEAYMDLSQQANEGKQQIDTKTIEEVPGVGWRAKLANGEEILVKGTNAENTLRDLVKNHNNDNHPLVISRGFTAERGLAGGHPWTITRADGFTVRAESLYDNYVFHDFAWNPANNIVMDSLVRRIPANEAEQRIALDFTQTGAINFKGQINAIRQAIANSNGRLELIKHPNAKRNALFTNTEMRVADTRFGIIYDITLNKKATNSNVTVTVTGITFTGNRVQLDSNVATQTLRSAANRGALNTEIVLRAPTAGLNITPVQSPDQTSWRFDTEEVDRIAAMAGAQIRQQTPNRVDMSIPAIAEGVQIQVPFSIRVDENGVVFVEANGQSIQVDGINDRYLGANEAQRTAQNARSILQVQALQGGEYEVVSRNRSTGEMRVRRTTNTGTTVEFTLDRMGQYVEDSLEVVAAPPASLNRLQQMIDDGINRQRARTSAQRQTQQGLGQLRDPDLRTYTDAELVNLGLDPATIRESLNRSIIYHITPIVHRVNSFEELEEELVKMGFPRHRFLTRTYVDSSGIAYGKWILRDRDDVHLGEYDDTKRGFRDLIADFTRENVESVFDTQDIVPYLLEYLVENNPGRTPLEFTNDEYQKVISKYFDYYDRVFRQEAQVQGVPLSTERRQEIETRIQQQIDDLLRGQLRLVNVREVLRLYGGLIVRGWAVEDPATNSFMDRNGNLVKERDNMDAFFDDLMSIPMNLVPANHNVVEIYRLNDTLYGYDELVEAGNDTDNINLITSTQNNRFEELVQEQINGYIEKPSQRARRGDRRYIDRLNSYLREKLQQVNAITDLGELVRFYVGLGLNMKQYATFRVEDNGVWMFLGKDGKRYTAATVKNNKSVAAITKWYEDETISPTKFAQSFKIGQIGYTLTQEDGTLIFDYKFAITNKDGKDLTQGQILSGQSQMMDKFKEFSVVSTAFDNFKTNDFINDELIREANSEGIVNAKDEGVIRTELIAELKTRLDNSNLLSDFQDVYGSQLQVRYGFRNLTPGNNYGKYFGTNGMKDMMGVDTFLTQEQAVAINDIWANNRANTEITVYYVFYNKEGTAIYAHSREEHLDALMIQLRSTQNLERIDLDAEIQTRVEESRRAAGLANARNQELRRQRQQMAGASLTQAQSTPAPSIPATTSSADQYLHSLLGDTGLSNITNLVYPFTSEYLQITGKMRDAYYATFVGSEVRDLNNSEHDLDAELMRLAGNLYKNAKKNGVVELYQTAIEFFNANQNARNSVLTEHAIEELRKTIQVTRRDVNFALELRRENRPLTAEQQGWVDEVDRIINGLPQDEREAIYRRQGVQGYWDSEAGRVILVAESIPLNHAHRVFAHELRVHATAHMTDDLAQNWVNIADFLKSQMGQNTEVGRALDRIYRFRAIQFDETRWGFWEEMAAYFVEDYEGRISFAANIKAHFRHWFRRSGIFKGNDDITAADIVVFAKAAGSYAINHHEQMKQPTEGIPAQGEFFSRLGTAFSVPENVARTEFEAVRNHYGSAERNVLMGSTFDRDTGMYQESNLNDAHWTLVRTPFYKKWFGDWEMNPNTASKIVDTNGEPLVIVHNTQHDYSAYDAPFVGNNGFFGHNGQYVYGKVGENLYNRRFSDRPRKALFLNVRNPLPLHNYELMAPIMERLGYEESAKRLDLWALADSVRSNLPLHNLLESIAGFAEDTDVDTSLADYLVLNDNNITSSFPGATFDEAHRFIVGLYEAATTPANSILTNDPVVDSESIAAYAKSIEDEATLTHLDAAAKVFDRRLEGFENQMLRLAYNPDGYFTSLDAYHGDLSIVTQEPITDILSAINQRALILGEEDMLEFKSAVVAAYDEILALENVSTLQGNEAFMNLFNLALHKMRLDEVSFRLGDDLTFRTEAAYPVPTTQSLLKEHNRRLAENMKSLMIREGFDGIAGTDDILLVHPDQAKDAHGFLNPFPSVNSRRTQGVTSTRMEETVMGLLDDAITKDARTLNVEPVRLRSEYRSIYRANFVDQPWMQSNLDEYSWIMARTPSFKQHYGEWQHDPTIEMNLDYRGEPVRESEGFIAPDRIVPIQDLEQAKTNNTDFYFVFPYSDTGNKTIVNPAYFSSISSEALERMRGDRKTVNLDALKAQDKELEQLTLNKAAVESALIVAQNERQMVEDLLTKTNEEIAQLEQTQAKKKLTKKQREKYDALIREREVKMRDFDRLMRDEIAVVQQVQDAENRISQLLNDPNYIDNVKKVNEQQIQDINDRKAAFIRDRANERVTLILRMGDINITLRDNPGLEQDAVNTLVNQRSAIFTQVNDVRDQAIQEVARMDDEVTRIITNDPMTQRQRELEYAVAVRNSLEQRIDVLGERIQEMTDEANLRVKGIGEKGLKQIQALQAQLMGLQTQLAEAQTREQGFEGEFTKLDQILAQKLDTLNQLAQMDGEIAAEQMEQAGKDAATILLVTGFERDKSGRWWYRGSNVNGKFRSPVDILYNLMEEIYALAGKKVPKRYSDAYAEFQTLQIEREKEVHDALKSGQKVSATQFKLYGQKQLRLVNLFNNFFFADMKKFSLNTPFEKFLAGITDANLQDQIKQLRNSVVRSGFVARDKGYLTLKDVYEDDDLYNAYPFLRDLKITFWTDGTQGWFKPGTTSYSAQINISPVMIAGTFRQALLHEIQHAIQWYEGLFYSYGDNLVYGADLSELQSHMVEFTSLIPEEDVRTITTEDFITNFFTDYTNGSVTLGNVETDWARPGSIFVPYVPDTGAPFAPLNAPSTAPQGLQKQADIVYPDFTEAQVSAYFSLSKRTREEAIAQMRKPREGRPDLTEEEMNTILNELDKYDSRKKQLLTLKWILNGSIAMPVQGEEGYEDEGKVNEAIATATNAGVDPFQYKSPMEIINTHKKFRPKAKPINPENVSELSDRIEIGDGIVTYLVQDDAQGQEVMRKIIDTHWGKEANPWCLLQSDGHGNLTRDALSYWNKYNALPKRVAFKNGRLLAFMATRGVVSELDTAIDRMLTSEITFDSVLMKYRNTYKPIRDILKIREEQRNLNTIMSFVPYTGGVSTEDEITEDIREFIQGNFSQEVQKRIFSAGNERTDWFREISNMVKELENEIAELTPKVKNFMRKKIIKVSYNQNTAKLFVNGNYQSQYGLFYYDSKNGTYLTKIPERWWDRNDSSHPNLDWARDTIQPVIRTPDYRHVYAYFSRAPQGSQKQANVQYPDFTEAQVDAYFSLSKRTRDEAIAQMRKPREGRSDLTEEQMNIILDELDKYDDRKKQLLTLKWILNGSIAMPIRGQQYEDEYKVDEAIKLAARNKVDPFKYESPVAILNEYMEFHPDSLPINPETFPEIVRDSRIDYGDGIVSYQIADTREGQETARKIINSHLGKGWSNWCLTRANTQGELQQPDSWEMWKHYNGLPKRMAFKNGKLISFMATSTEYDIRSAFDSMLDTIRYEPELMSNYMHVTDIRNMIEIINASRGIRSLIFNSSDVRMFRDVLMSEDDKIVKALRYFPAERVNELGNLQSLEDWNRYVRANFEELRKEMFDAEDKIEGRRLQFKRYYEELIDDPESFRIEKSEDGNTAFIVTGDGKRVNIPYNEDYEIDYTADFIYDAEQDDYFAEPQEQWWDTNDNSHPNLDWARGTVEGYTPRHSVIDPNQVIGYFSRTGSPLGNVTNYNTDIYDRTPIPGAPGAYKLRNGQIFINPDEVADEHVARNILYALIRENRQAMENKNIAAIIDTIKGWENSADTRERNFWATIANNIHLAGLSGDKPIIAYAAREFLNQHIDARNPQGTNTIEGVFAALLNEIPEIIGQVANTSTSNVNAMPSDIITVTNALGEVRNDTIEVAVPGLQITERDLEITQRRIMAPQFMEGVMEDIKRLIDTYENADFQFIKGQGWLRYGDMMWNVGSNLLGMRNIVDQIMHGTIDYGNYDMTDTTDEEANTPRSAFRDFVQRLPKDSPLRNQATRPDVEEFLRVFPAYIRDRIKVAYSREPEWEELFGEDKNGIYKPYLADREIIFIKAYDRTLADVVGTISYLVSRFGWTMWNNSDFAPLMDELYTVLKHNIKEELPSFFEKLQGNAPTPSEKSALVSAFISHMGGTVYELEYFAKKSSFVPSADEQKVIDIGKRFREKITELELRISRTFARDFAENEEITKEYVEKLLRLTMAPISGQGLFFAYDVDHDNLRQYDGSVPSSMQKWENLSHVTVFGNDYGPLYQSIPSSEDALTNMYMANRFRNASPYWRNVYKWWWRNRHPPMKRPGDTILGLENTVMLGRAFKAVTQEFGLALKNIYKNVTALRDELMRKGIDTDEFTESKGYEQELRDRGVTDEKLLEKAKITDTFLRYGRQRVLENVIEIRALVRYTSQRLEYWMRQENALSRDIQKMHAEMERFANRFVSDWDHRKYQAYTEDGQNDLHEMRTIVNAARVTNERWYSDIVEQNKTDLSNLEKKKQTGQIDEKTYAKERKKLRHAIKIHERLDALFHWATQDEMSQLPPQGSPGYDQRLSDILKGSRQAMINKIDEIMREVETYKERGVIGKMDLIPGARKRTLNENDPHDLLEITFLDPVKDPALQLIFNLDQQGKITDKLIFNLRFGENLLAGGIATIKGSSETTPIRVDNLSWLENGTFLRYVQVDPFFMDEISNEVKLQDYIRNNIFSEIITTVKQNLTILNWRMAISNYIGNISNLILTGEIFRIQNLRKGMRLAKDKWWNLFLTDYNKSVEKIPERVFAKSINEASAEYNELIKTYQHEMDKLNIWGSGISSAEITMYGHGGWEKHVDLIAAAFQTTSEMANTDTFDDVTRRKWQRAAHSFMRSAREFYGFGDEWVKPLTYLNNRAVALAKYRALHNWSRYEGFENTPEAKRIDEQIMDAATREAALLTFKETTTWELSPDIVRQLARTRVRVLTPDFLLHAFQMVRIYATNLYRTKEVAEEIARLRAKGKENLNPYEEAYLSLLRNEFWRRTAGQGIYTWIAAELATYGGSSLAWIFGSFAAFLSGGGGDDDEKRKKRKEEREKSPFGTTFDEHVGMSMLLTGISQVGNLYMPLMWVPGKVGHEFYAYNGQRAHAALTITPVTPPTTDPSWLERFNIILKQIVNYDSDPLSLQIANIVRQKNSFGQKITGKEQLFEMLGLLTPQVIQQGINIGRGTNELMTGTEELPWRERKKHRELAMFDVAGFKVQRVSVDDNIENLGRMIDNLASTGRNPYRREFFKKLENNLDMDESAIKSAVDDILTVNERDMGRVRWILESFRKMGVEKKRLESHLAAARNTGSTILGKQYVGQLLAGRNVLNSLLLTSLNEKISSAEKLREGTDFPPNERRKVIDNYRRAMRMIQGADL